MNSESFFRSRVSEQQNSCSKTNFKSIAIISSANDAMRRVFLVVLIGLMVACALVLTGCGRASGEFPNIPELMDECQSWSAEEFASKMNLELNSKLAGGSKVAIPQEAKDLSQSMGGDIVAMSLSETLQDKDCVVEIRVQADHDGELYSFGDISSTYKEFDRYDFDYKEALKFLEALGIKEGSIKVYDDQSSGGTKSDYLFVYWGYQYDMCGEARTKKGEPLFFSLEANAGFLAQNNDTSPTPIDYVDVQFTTSKPFALSDELFRQ